MTVRTFGEPGLDQDEPQSFAYQNEPVTRTTPSNRQNTVLSLLRTELSKPSEAIKEITLTVRARPAVSVKYNTDIDVVQMDAWRKRARKNQRKADSDIDVILMNMFIMQSQCLGIFVNGEQAIDDNGEPITFVSPEFADMLQSLDTNGAIKKLYERDPDILKTGQDILKAAGYDMDDEEEDPLD